MIAQSDWFAPDTDYSLIDTVGLFSRASLFRTWKRSYISGIGLLIVTMILLLVQMHRPQPHVIKIY